MHTKTKYAIRILQMLCHVISGILFHIKVFYIIRKHSLAKSFVKLNEFQIGDIFMSWKFSLQKLYEQRCITTNKTFKMCQYNNFFIYVSILSINVIIFSICKEICLKIFIEHLPYILP